MSVATLPPIPTDAPAIQLDGNGKPLPKYPMSQDLYLWLFQLAGLTQAGTGLVGNAVQLLNQSAAIGSTPMALPALNAGLYGVSFYAAVTSPAGVSSTLGDFTVSWTDGAISKSSAATGVTGNLNTTVLLGYAPIQLDGASAINYSMGYASNPASAMVYKLTIAVTRIVS